MEYLNNAWSVEEDCEGHEVRQDCEGEDGTSRHQAVDERRRARAKGAFEGPHTRHQGFEGDEAHGWRSPPPSRYPRRRSRPPPVSFSVFRVLLHSDPPAAPS